MVAAADARRAGPGPAGAAAILSVGGPALDGRLPALPAAALEAERVAALYGAPALSGAAATKRAVLDHMNAARHLHFATHGLLNRDAPLYSALAFARSAGVAAAPAARRPPLPAAAGEPADDGMLYAREILDMKPSADLAVLGACDTARGQRLDGEGVLGLSWTFAAAGVPCTVVTQWSVADDSTARLMTGRGSAAWLARRRYGRRRYRPPARCRQRRRRRWRRGCRVRGMRIGTGCSTRSRRAICRRTSRCASGRRTTTGRRKSGGRTGSVTGWGSSTRCWGRA